MKKISPRIRNVTVGLMEGCYFSSDFLMLLIEKKKIDNISNSFLFKMMVTTGTPAHGKLWWTPEKLS